MEHRTEEGNPLLKLRSSIIIHPPQLLQPRSSWCPFSRALSWRHLSSSVAVDLAGLLKPSGSHVRACRGSLWWSIRDRCPSHLRRRHLIMSSSFGSAVASLTFSFVTLSFQEIPSILRCHSVVCYIEVFFILVIETGHSSALLSNVERTSASWSLVFTGNWSRCIAAKNSVNNSYIRIMIRISTKIERFVASETSRPLESC